MENEKKIVCSYNGEVEENKPKALLVYKDKNGKVIPIKFAKDVDMAKATALADDIGSWYCHGGYARYEDGTIKCSNGVNTWEYSSVLEFLADWYSTITITHHNETVNDGLTEEETSFKATEIEFVQNICFCGLVPHINF